MATSYVKLTRGAREHLRGMQFSGEKPSFVLYGGVGLVALLKDLLDLAGIGSFPGIGWLITFCSSFLIWMLLALFDRSGAKSNLAMARGLVILFFGTAEMFAFGINFLPIQTFSVIVLYVLAKRAWKKAEQQAKRQAGQLSKAEKVMRYREEQALLIAKREEEERVLLEQEALEAEQALAAAKREEAARSASGPDQGGAPQVRLMQPPQGVRNLKQPPKKIA